MTDWPLGDLVAGKAITVINSVVFTLPFCPEGVNLADGT
jgi:hypothetical protein